MKRIYKWVGMTIAVFLLLVFLLSLLFYFPPFQNWAVKQVATYASEKTGMQISVERVRLAFPLDLAVENIKVLQPHDNLKHQMDTIADIDKVVVDVQLWPLFSRQVMVDRLTFKQMKVNTDGLIDNVQIRGQVGELGVKAHGIDLRQELMTVTNARLSNSNLTIALSDTVPADTTPSENKWKVSLQNLQVKNSNLAIHLPGDTMSVEAYLGNATAKNTFLDLGKGLYTVRYLEWKNGRLLYDQNYQPTIEGLDYNHIALTDLAMRADSFYYCDSKIDVKIRKAQFKEKSGLDVSSMTGHFVMDKTRLALQYIKLRTPGTALLLDYAMDLNTFDDTNPGTMKAIAHGHVGKKDLMIIIGNSFPKTLVRQWPNEAMTVDGELRGNLQKMQVKDLSLKLPGAFQLKGNGFVANVTDMNHLKADIDVKATTYNIGFVTSQLDPELMKTIRIPNGIGFDGNVKIDGNRYASTFTAIQGGGSVKGNASIDVDRMIYRAALNISQLPLQNFVPHMGLHPFTGRINVQGAGTDIMSPQTKLQADIEIKRFSYGEYNLDKMDATATMGNGVIKAHVDSRNDLLQGIIDINAQTDNKLLQANISADLTKADLYQLHISDEPLVVTMRGDMDVTTDMKQYYKAKGALHNVMVNNQKQEYQLEDVTLDVMTSHDATHAIVDCGDLHLSMDGAAGYEQLIKETDRFVQEMENQLKNKHIDQARLRRCLPDARIYLMSGQGNIASKILRQMGYELAHIRMDITSSPMSGLNGSMLIDSLVVDSIQLDTVRLNISSDDKNMTYTAQLRNRKGNPTYVFNALFDGGITEKGAYLKSRVYDDNDKLGIRMGLQGTMEAKGIRLRLDDDDPILGYKTFTVNDSNYVFLGDDRRISANMILKAADGTGVQIYTNDSNMVALQDVTVSLHRFNLGNVLSVIPYTPDITGIMDGDFHVIQTEKELSISAAINVDDMFYGDCPMGDLGTEFTYMPKADGTHVMVGILMQGGEEVGTLEGTYRSQGDGHLDATLGLDRFPLDLLNGFVPDRIIGFKGYGEGGLTIKGSLSKPNVNGEVYLDSGYIFSEPYGVEMRFANDPVTITNSRLLFENFEMFAGNDSPLNVQGYFDFANIYRMTLNMRMRAQNFLLIDAKETMRSEAYGKAYVNFMGMMNGPVDNLKLRGRLDVLGTTELEYNLKDTPLSSDNQLDGLVTFINFNDTAEEVVSRPPLTGLDMDMTVAIDEGAHIDCYLNTDHTNYLEAFGGGTLRMRYNVVDGINLTGRYTIDEGTMKYALPIFPLKTFNIKEGSYVEFKGDPMDPALNITATETTKSTVGSDSGDGRAVEFTCGVVVTKTLSDMGLEFIIDAPEDMTVSNQLQSMSKEQRGKLAVTMLTTGMYLADGNTSSFTMNSALSAFLNSQINQISGKALQSLDVSIGVDNSFTGTGALHTDYSFKFAKRFLNNRLRVIVGGKLSSGAEVSTTDESFFDNVTVEYRLSPISNIYLNGFYERDSYDWLEGTVSKYGGGFLWKRQVRHFKDIFRFKSSNEKMPPLPALSDSTKTDSIKK